MFDVFLFARDDDFSKTPPKGDVVDGAAAPLQDPAKPAIALIEDDGDTFHFVETSDAEFARLIREADAADITHTPEWTDLNDVDPGITLQDIFGDWIDTGNGDFRGDSFMLDPAVSDWG